MPSLFEPFTLRGMTTRNRIWLAPMCQYSCFAQDGMPNDWQLVHLGARATGGFGLILTEASAVLPNGRISPQDAGIWSDDHIPGWKRVTDFVHTQDAKIGIQLAHAGRKASTYGPFDPEEGTSVAPDAGGWQTIAPSAVAFTGLAEPAELSVDEIAEVVAAFGAAAERAESAGFDAIEIHSAHGYLLHEFMSPLSNQRTDQYGGSFENRTRIVVEVVDAIRAVWSQDKPLLIRFSATDWFEGGWSTEDTGALTKLLVDHGVDLVDVSTGALVREAKIEVGPGYQVPFARAVREFSGMATGAVGMITDAQQAQQILDEGSADVVFIGRAALREPSWPLRAASDLEIPWREAGYPTQYLRGAWRNEPRWR
ncbi:NADH:flavin oxidoreductase/NADH oxidase [Aeromicrobium wangtongii]|uniref:NADH:flavin oxidoreductase/NADH oxidase n=1 Tax=Aeromicrobium wangtongii TaxID=2969247 RepID=UPI002016E22E|nr:NADH:flavin oxidoreductase/NADH oxidase [Aeromicrobium wangtongii]MCL3816947.1 NADH:flavin oxidoreductase/NADH oxidase [Aeromicrobium wangtongii]